MPTLGSLCFSILRLIQLSKEGQGENLNEQTDIKGRLIYASLKGQPIMPLISQALSSEHEINTCRCTTLDKIK